MSTASCLRRSTCNGSANWYRRLARRIDHRHAVLFQKSAEIVHRLAAGELEGVLVETDVALAIFVFPPLRIGGGDPEQGLAVAPAGHVAIFVFQFEAEKF